MRSSKLATRAWIDGHPSTQRAPCGAHGNTRTQRVSSNIMLRIPHVSTHARQLVIVLLRATMGALPWSARGSKQRVHVRETKKRRKRARSGRAPRVCAECTFGHTLQHANTTLLLQKICFRCNMFVRMILRTLSSCSNGFPSRGLAGHARTPRVVECACNSVENGDL